MLIIPDLNQVTGHTNGPPMTFILPRHTPCRQRGFTLLELAIVVVIAAILLTLAVPSFNALIQGSRIDGDASALVSDLMLARSEAIKRRGQVALCASTGGATCDTNDWSLGWLVYMDADSDGTLTSATIDCPPTPTATADCILRKHAAISDGNELAVKPTISQLAFRPDGTVRDVATTEQFEVCTSRTILDDRERIIRVEVSGHVAQEAYTCE